MRRRFSPDQEKALRRWHAGLDGNRGARARLRRASSPEDVIFLPELYQFLKEIQADGVKDPEARRKLAALAGLAARVRKDPGDLPLPRQMGSPGKGSGPAVSEARFRRLLTTSSLDDRYSQLSRIIQLLGGTVDLLSLAEAVVDWDDDPDLRQRWAYEYYQAVLS